MPEHEPSKPLGAEENPQELSKRKEIFEFLESAKEWLKKYGVDDLTTIEGVRLRKIVEECFVQHEDNEKELKEYEAMYEKQKEAGAIDEKMMERWSRLSLIEPSGVAMEAAARWLWEVYDITRDAIRVQNIITDKTTGEVFRYDVPNFPKLTVSGRKDPGEETSFDRMLEWNRENSRVMAEKTKELKALGHEVSEELSVVEPAFKEYLARVRDRAHNPETEIYHPPKLEQKEKEPKLEYVFLLSSHLTAEDFRQMETLFSECDVYVPELANWRPEFIEAIRKLSEGEIPLDEFIATRTNLNKNTWDTANRERYSILAGSHKPIFLAEAPWSEESPGIRNMPAFQSGVESSRLLREGLVEEAIQKRKESIYQFAASFRRREEHISRMLKEPLKEFIETIPNLRDKEKVKVLVQIGTGHTGPYHELKKEGAEAQRIFNVDPVLYSLQDVAVRKLLFNPEAQVTDMDAKLSMVNSRITGELHRRFEQYDIGKDTELITSASVRITRSLTPEQIERYFKDLKNKLSIEEALSNLGNILPTTPEDLEKIAGVKQIGK